MTVKIDTDAVINNVIMTDQGSAPTTPGAGKTKIFTKSDGLHIVNSNGYDSFVGLYNVCNGRLTLTSGTAVTTADVTAATALYFNPYKGNQVGLYNGTSWDIVKFDVTPFSLVGITGSVNYDVFAYNNAGTLALETMAWSDATTRSTSLAFQDGIYVKSGTSTRRYLGTIRASANGQCEDSVTKRFVWNYYNGISRKLLKRDATSHSYTTVTWRSWNNDATLRVNYVMGVSEYPLWLSVAGEIDADDGAAAYVALGVDITDNVTEYLYADNGNATTMRTGVSQDYYSAIGYHFVQIVQLGQTSAVFPDAMVAGHIWG